MAHRRWYTNGVTPWVVGILTPADEYLAGLLSAVQEVWPKADSIGIVRAASGAFPRDVASGVEKAARDLGFRMVLSRKFDPDGAEFSQVVRDACETAPDVLVVVGRFQNDLVLADLLAEAAPKVGAL